MTRHIAGGDILPEIGNIDDKENTLPERKNLEIKFPRVEGYVFHQSQEIRKNSLTSLIIVATMLTVCLKHGESC